MNQALIFHHNHFCLAVRIVVVLPALRLLVVFEDAAAPNRVIDLVFRRADGVGPDFVHGSVAIVEQGPLPGAGVEAAGASRGRGPNEVPLHTHAVDDVIAQAGVELGEAVDAACGNAAQSAHGARPHIARAMVEGEREHRLMSQSILRTKNLPHSAFVKPKPVFGSGPDAVAVHQHAKNMIVRQPTRSREVVPTKHGHDLGHRRVRK